MDNMVGNFSPKMIKEVVTCYKHPICSYASSDMPRSQNHKAESQIFRNTKPLIAAIICEYLIRSYKTTQEKISHIKLSERQDSLGSFKIKSYFIDTLMVNLIVESIF